MRLVFSAIRPAFLVGLWLVSANNFAEVPGSLTDGARWACWYEPRTLTLECVLQQAPTAGHAERAAAVARHFDPRLPAGVRTIWGSPERLAARRIHIPLWNTPFEMDFARELAEAVMCGARKDCAVRFDANADGNAARRVAPAESPARGLEALTQDEASPAPAASTPGHRDHSPSAGG